MLSNTNAEVPQMSLAQKFKAQKAAALKKAMEEENRKEQLKAERKKNREEKRKATQLKKREAIKKIDCTNDRVGSKKRKQTEETQQMAKKARIEESTEMRETEEERKKRLKEEKEAILITRICVMEHQQRPRGQFGPFLPRPQWMDAEEVEEGEFALRKLGETWIWIYNERVFISDHKAGYIPLALRSETDE